MTKRWTSTKVALQQVRKTHRLQMKRTRHQSMQSRLLRVVREEDRVEVAEVRVQAVRAHLALVVGAEEEAEVEVEVEEEVLC